MNDASGPAKTLGTSFDMQYPVTMTNEPQCENIPADTSEIMSSENAGKGRDFGPQPIADLMAELQLKPHDLVLASTEQLTHKMVARAMKGRQLTSNSRGIVQRAFNRATQKTWTQAQLFNYCR
jgi:hypothetical protein